LQLTDPLYIYHLDGSVEVEGISQVGGQDGMCIKSWHHIICSRCFRCLFLKNDFFHNPEQPSKNGTNTQKKQGKALTACMLGAAADSLDHMRDQVGRAIKRA
jgi:hypothetical protein